MTRLVVGGFRFHPFLALPFGLCLAAACDAPQGARHEGEAATRPEAATESKMLTASAGKDRAADAVAAREEIRTERRAWWHSPAMIEALALTKSQRAAMDRAFDAYPRQRDKLREGQRHVATELTDALKRSDWKAARAAERDLAQRRTDLQLARLDATIAVLQALDDEQRKIVAEDYPHIYRGQWLSPPRPLRRRGAGRRQPTEAGARPR